MAVMAVVLAAAAGHSAVARVGGGAGLRWRSCLISAAFVTGGLAILAGMFSILVATAGPAKTLGLW